PIVFRSSRVVPLLGRYTSLGYIAIGMGMLSLCAWTLLRRPAVLFCGLLAGSALLATLLGVLLLPLSVLGMFAVIGVLGLSPFATAFVFWRNAFRAEQMCGGSKGDVRAMVVMAIGFAVTSVSPWAAQYYVEQESSRATALVLSADSAAAAQGI